jgi:hypothetical protein
VFDSKQMKVGDEVAVTNHHGLVQLANIDRITPTGRIVVNRVTYRPDGYEMGGGYNCLKIEVVTEKHRKAWMRKRRIERLQSTRWETLTDDQLKSACAALSPKLGSGLENSEKVVSAPADTSA